MIQQQRVMSIPAILSARHRAPAAAAVPWWLSGGVSAANAIAVYQPKGAASLAASYVNLANPGTYDAAPGVAPTFNAATGWTFNGTTQYLIIGVAPASGWSMMLRYSDAATSIGWGALCGMAGTGGGNRWFLLSQSSSKHFFGAGNYVEASTFASSGVIGIAGQQGYKSGSPDGGIIGNWDTPNGGISIAVGQANAYGSITWALPGGYKCQAFAIYSTTLTAPQVAAVSAAMAAL